MTGKRSEQTADPDHRIATWAGYGLVALFHTAMTLVVAAGLALVVFDTSVLLHCAALVEAGSFAPSAWRLVGHVGLSALLWGGGVLAFRTWRRRSRERTRAIQPERGAVMLETLIVMLPLLLLTSGIAQLAINNVATVLAQYAAFQGARTAWLWEPEMDVDRQPSGNSIDRDQVRLRARMAAAGAMAPSAPADFRIPGGRTVPEELENYRATMAATFMPGWRLTGNMAKARVSSRRWGNRGHGSSFQTFARAFDSEPLSARAPRKLTFAYQAFRPFELIDNSREVGVEFTYNLQQVFPWFAYIHGTYNIVGGRPGYYLQIRRRSTIRPQVRH